MIDLRSELPLGGDSATAYIPWLVAIMVFLGTLAVSGVHTFDSILQGWSRSVTGTLTVQIPSAASEASRSEPTAQIDRVVRALNATQIVDSVTVLSESELNNLLAPWLGDDIGASNIPLPTLIDVTLTDEAPQTLEELRTAIAEVVPNAVVDDHRRWFEHLIELTEGFRLLALCVVCVVAIALALTVVYATRASLAEFKDIIALFHFIGAQDMYVATQFAKRTFLAAFKGSVGGCTSGTVTLLLIGWLAQNVESGFLPDVSLGLSFWLTLPFIGILAALLAMVTAYITVLGTLRTMM